MHILTFKLRMIGNDSKLMPRLHLTVLTTRNEPWRLWI